MKEPVNTWTHFITFLAGIAGLIFLILISRESPSQLVTMTIYGSSIILLYGASSLYHWVSTTPSKELMLKKLDHVSIYILIGGSYTPVFFYGLEGAWKWSMLVCIWALITVGIILKLFFIRVPRSVSTLFYIALGWMAVIPFGQLLQNLPYQAIILMISGGIAYTVGGVIYATKIFDFYPNRFGFHEIFHLFVMAGSVIHFIMIVMYVMPRT
ncbi:hemolysin III family channel protein [Paenibacillus swuensis]|uniref:Hemolysin III family channel protein n=2 Tax=Paenibacillus swuensis TaxID=1178515 RepID=A0A172TPZ7_9BACL|nr:hemolysin III family channel protein [Paenibacillus swuensis]